MATTSHQYEHETSSNAAEQTRFEHDKCKKLYNDVNYQFVESLKRHQISKAENFTKSQRLNKLIQT